MQESSFSLVPQSAGLEELIAKAQKLAEASRTESTHRAMKSSWNDVEAWCRQRGFPISDRRALAGGRCSLSGGSGRFALSANADQKIDEYHPGVARLPGSPAFRRLRPASQSLAKSCAAFAGRRASRRAPTRSSPC